MARKLQDISVFSPTLRAELSARDKAMMGDMTLVVSPATATPAPTAAAWTQDVKVQLQDANGNLHSWFTKAVTSGVSIADTSAAGTAAIASTTLSFEGGEAVFAITGDAASWLDTETATATIAEMTIMGNTVAEKTCVLTFTA